MTDHLQKPCARCGNVHPSNGECIRFTPPVTVPEMTVDDATRYLRHFCDPNLMGGSYEEDRDAIVTLLTAFERQQPVVEAARAWGNSDDSDPIGALAAELGIAVALEALDNPTATEGKS